MDLATTEPADTRPRAAMAAIPLETKQQSPVTVAVASYHPPMVAELLPALTATSDLRFLPAVHSNTADVLLVLTTDVTDAVLDGIQRTASIADNPSRCTVLISDPLRERHLSRALAAGVVSMLPRRQANARAVHRAILASHEGRPLLPDSVVRWLVDDFRALREKMLDPLSTQPGGFTEREIEVLRLLAEGESNAEIAERMNYSQRTIKKIVQDLLVRLNLKNRSHAVSYAMRIGAI